MASSSTIYRTVSGSPFSDRYILGIISEILKKLGRPKASVSVHVIGDTRMTTLNRRHRRMKGTTDVLSFPTQEGLPGFFPSNEMGDIFISYPQICRQAKKHGIRIQEEFTRMLVHGVLHLFGFDHGTKAEQAKMYPLQEAIVKRVL